jgi:hypothetical protein
MSDTTQEESDVDTGELWDIDEFYLADQVYIIKGKAAPRLSEAVAKAKKKYADEHDVEFRHLTGKKIADITGSLGQRGCVVYVCHRPEREANKY